MLIINSNFRIVKDTYAMSEGKTMISEEVIKCFRGESTTRYDKTNGYIEMTVPITETVDGEKGQTSIVRGVILASASTDSIATTLDILSRKEMCIRDRDQVAGNVPAVMTKLFETMKETVGIDLAEVVKAGTYDAKVNRNITINADGAKQAAEVLKQETAAEASAEIAE